MKKTLSEMSPTKLIPLGFIGLILIGTFLLMMPFSTVGASLHFFDALFEAVSATCVTGLVVVDTGTTFTFFGQLILLILIQLGGLGFMTFATFIFVISGRKIGLKERVIMAESVGESRLTGIIRLAISIFRVTAIMELGGALLLSFRFIPQFGALEGIWRSIFTSVSAFCNAGFDIMGNYESMTGYVGDPLVNVSLYMLIIIGGLGFGVVVDVLNVRKKRKLRIQTKIVLWATLILVFVPAVFFFFLEYNGAMKGFSLNERILASLFQSITCRTAGFNSIDQMALCDASKLLSIVLMFIGGAPAGTAGGIKITTSVVMLTAIISFLKGSDRTQMYERYISRSTVIRAFIIFFIAITVLCTGVFLVSIFERGSMNFLDEVFELTSAIATVGLSAGVCGSASLLTRAVICAMMFTGRVGIMTVVIAIGGKKEKPYIKYPEADIMVG